MRGMIPLSGAVFPLPAILAGAGIEASLETAEVEQVRLRVNGETDSLEQALIAQKILSRPSRTHENSRLDSQRFTLERLERPAAPSG
jgi:hypothetical protein